MTWRPEVERATFVDTDDDHLVEFSDESNEPEPDGDDSPPWYVANFTFGTTRTAGPL